MLIGTPIPPSTPDKLSTDDEYEAPSHPGMTTLYAPAEGITSSSLDPRRANPVAREPDTLDNMTPDVHEDSIPNASVDPVMPESTLSTVPAIETMVIGIGNRTIENTSETFTNVPQATGVGPTDTTAVHPQATGIGSSVDENDVQGQSRSAVVDPMIPVSDSVPASFERTNPTSISQEASGVGFPHVIQTDPAVEAFGVGPPNDVQMDPVVGSAASSSSRPTRDQPTVPTESLDAPAESVSDVIGPMSVFRDESDPDPNLTAQNNLRSLMADLSSVPLEGHLHLNQSVSMWNRMLSQQI